MPLFMDVHNRVDGATSEAVAGAHQKDLEIQAQYGVKHLKYWLDRHTGRIFCLAEAPNKVKGIAVISRKVEGVDASMLRELAENTGAKIGSGVVVLGLASNGKASLVAVVSEDLQKRLHAGKIIKRVAELVGGSGGGRPDFAQAGGKDAEKLEGALQAVYNIVAEFLT